MNVTLQPNETQEVSWEFIPTQAKTYLVQIDNLEASFNAIAEEIPTEISVTVLVTFGGSPESGIQVFVGHYPSASGIGYTDINGEASTVIEPGKIRVMIYRESLGWKEKVQTLNSDAVVHFAF